MDTAYPPRLGNQRQEKKMEDTNQPHITSSFEAKFRGETIGYFATADEAQAAIDAAEEASEEN